MLKIQSIQQLVHMKIKSRFFVNKMKQEHKISSVIIPQMQEKFGIQVLLLMIPVKMSYTQQLIPMEKLLYVRS